MKKFLCILLISTLMLSFFSCSNSNRESVKKPNSTKAQSESLTEEETISKSERLISNLRDAISFADDESDFKVGESYLYRKLNVELNLPDGALKPAMACTLAYQYSRKTFPNTLTENEAFVANINTAISMNPIFFRDSDIVDGAKGEYTYVLLTFLNKEFRDVAPEKINDIYIQNGIFTVEADLCFTEGAPSGFINLLILKMKTEQISEHVDYIKVSVNNVNHFKMNITSLNDDSNDGNGHKEMLTDADMPILKKIFDRKIEGPSWSEDIEFDCYFEFQGRTVYFSSPLKIYAEDQKCYSLTDEETEIIDSATYPRLFGKPVIYFYPESDTVCSVELDFDGELTCTYPDYSKGWSNFVAKPDGTLVFPNGKEYYCLYWEGKSNNMIPDLTRGFCVKGSESAEFLDGALTALGLNAREENEFIIYWLPILEANEYNIITFQTDAYTDVAKLNISPTPDSVLRIFMFAYEVDHYVKIEPQVFETFERNGFTVVEWGGNVISSHRK